MKKILVFFCLAVFTFTCAPTEKPDPVPTVVPTPTGSLAYQPFPAGFGYMENIPELQNAVNTGNTDYVRQHAWGLWAGIMQPAQGLNWPVWYTWNTTKQTFAPAPTTTLAASVGGSLISKSLLALNIANLGMMETKQVIQDDVPLPKYPIPAPVVAQYSQYGVFNKDTTSIAVGTHYLFNGDIMIPTESLSQEGFDTIRNKKYYQQAELTALHAQGNREIDLPQKFIDTKHMYWPVLAGQLSAIPVWRNDYGPEFTGYAGYEVWNNLIAIDPSGAQVNQTQSVTYLYGVLDAKGNPINPITKDAVVYGLEDFYYHQVDSADWASFDPADRAIINASSYWAYNKPFGPGDYLVTVACHVVTKEIPTWAMQTAWWSDQPDNGPDAANRPSLPNAVGPWDHYKLTASYGIPLATGDLPPAYNPYIELVIHPVATNCNNCHNRAGWNPVNGKNTASYQNKACPDLLEKLSPQSACLSEFLLTDFAWLIPDHAIE